MIMIKIYFFKKYKNINAKMSVFSYIMTSTLPVFAAIIVTIGMIDYFNGGASHYHGEYILKIIKLVLVSSFFSILYSVVSFFLDKVRIKKIINQFKHEYNEMNCIEGADVINNLGENIFDAIGEIKKRQVHYGGLKELNIQSISVIVTGMNRKVMEYRISCISLYTSERTENIHFNLYAINGGDLMLNTIEYSVDIEQAGV